MKISYNALNGFFGGKLPSAEVVADSLTFHAWEIEEVVPQGNDVMIDVKVLPDKSGWALSHRGIAHDLSVILDVLLTDDPLQGTPELIPHAPELKVGIETPMCTRYTAALIKGVTVGKSPAWLKEVLATLGQRSINNIVDITNYVMFMTGQPLHAFDVGKLQGSEIRVRNATDGEMITTLTGESYVLSPADGLIVDGLSNEPVGVAGIKGGKRAEVDMRTVDILLESAHFNALTVRKTSQRLKLRTDASTRYENGIVSDLTAYGLQNAVVRILDIAGGALIGYADTGKVDNIQPAVSVTLTKINSVLGLSLAQEDVEAILKRFHFSYTTEGGTFFVTPPFMRTDLILAVDVIEEIGRIYGYEHIQSILPVPAPLTEINTRFYYAERIRNVLLSLGFSEVFTSSFRFKDTIKLQNALASDKEYLRSTLVENITEALAKNIPNADLIGVQKIKIFEIGTVFGTEGESYALAMGVSGKGAKKELDEALAILAQDLGIIGSFKSEGTSSEDILEIKLDDEFLSKLPVPEVYQKETPIPDVTYVPFSLYPAMSRDIAFWVPEGTTRQAIESLLEKEAGALRVRTTLFDEFMKDGKTSYAYRLVFQSKERTLTDEEINPIMESIYAKVSEAGWEPR